MKYALVASMMALGLAACGGGGGGDKAALVEKCMEEDNASKEACTCQVNAMEDVLGSDTLKKLAKLAETEDEAGTTALMMELATAKPNLAVEMGEAMAKCAG